MATTNVKWNIPAAGSLSTVLSTGLNSLTNTGVVTSSVIANRTDLFQYAQFELNVTASSVPAGAYANVWLINNIGTGYETVTTASLARPAEVTLALNVKPSGNQTVASPVLLIPPNDFKVAFQNQAGVTLSASGSTLNIIRFIDQGSDA